MRARLLGAAVVAALGATLLGGGEVAHAASPIPSGVCNVLTDAGGNVLASKLPKIVTGGKYSGGLAWSLLVKIATQQCRFDQVDELLRAKPVFYGLRDRPADLDVVLRVLPPAPTSTSVYTMLSSSYRASHPAVDTGAIDVLVRNLCADATGSRQGAIAADLAARLPDARIAELDAVQGLARLVLGSCPRADAAAADRLNSELTDAVLANTFPRDVTPPTMLFVTVGRDAATSSVTLRWSAVDLGGPVRDYDVFVRTGPDRWKRLLGPAPVTSLDVSSYPRSTFAVRATDAAGNSSRYSFVSG